MSLWTGRAFVSGRILNFQERFSASHGKHLNRSFFSPFFARAGSVLLARTPFAPPFAQLLCFCRAGFVLFARTGSAPFLPARVLYCLPARLLRRFLHSFCVFARTGLVSHLHTRLLRCLPDRFCAPRPNRPARGARKKALQKSAARAEKIRRYLTTD